MMLASWVLTEGHGPVAAVALHDGHAVRREVAALFALNELDVAQVDAIRSALESTVPGVLDALKQA